MKTKRPPSDRYFKLIFISIVLLPLVIVLGSVISGDIPFWYDNARDLLSAWDNLSDPTLIGPTSGLFGVYYGPYWIWLLSLSLIFTKDPRFASIIVGVVPYFVIFPLLVYRLSAVIGRMGALFFWTFFIFSVGITYVVNMWNPHLAPFLTLLLITILVFTDPFKGDAKNIAKVFCAGLVSGLVINTHIAFGIGIALGLFVFLLAKYIPYRKKISLKNLLISLALCFLGLIASFAPFLIFEIRNGFMQMNTVFITLMNAGGNVGVEGLNTAQIVEIFFGRLASVLGVGNIMSYLIQIGLAIYLLTFLSRRKALDEEEKNLLLILSSFIMSVLTLFLLARNPIWAYHFIGVEILLALMGAYIIGKSAFLKGAFGLWIAIFLVFQLGNLVNMLTGNREYSSNTYHAKKQVVDTILEDAREKDFAFFAYSPSIYMYEYSYLFRWLGNKSFSFDPGQMEEGAELEYVVIPKDQDELVVDFINYRSSNTLYQTAKKWEINNDIIILRRERSL